MIRLLQYILESIHTAELTKELKFEEMSLEEAEKIMLEKDNLARLGFDIDALDNMVLFYDSKHFKIMYNDTCLGIYAYYDLNQNMTIPNTKTKAGESIYYITKRIFDDINKMYRCVVDSVKYNVLDNMRYITYLLMFPQAQQKEDIDSIATIKAFFNILKDECKKAGKKIIAANGKDIKTSKLYCKCGGFKNYANDPKNPYNIKSPRVRPNSMEYIVSTSTVFYTL